MFTFTGFDLTLGSARGLVAEAFVADTDILMCCLMALWIAKILL